MRRRTATYGALGWGTQSTPTMAAALEAVPLICLAVIRPLGDSRTLHKDFREAAGISRGLYSSVGMMMSTVVV